MLTPEDVDATLNLAKGILYRDAEPDFAEDLLEPVGSLIGAEMAAFREVDTAGGRPRIGRHAATGVPDRLHNQYLDEFYKLDPAISAASVDITSPHLASITEVRRSDSRSARPRTWVSDAHRRYVEDFLVPNRLLTSISLHIRTRDHGRLFLLDFHRPSSSAIFSDRELMMVQMICPSIQLFCTRLLPGAAVHAEATGGGSGRLLFEFGGPAAAPTPEADPHDAMRRFDGLTAREKDIVLAVMKGFSNKQMARHLGISVRTAENHLRTIYRKCGVHSRTQLTSKLMHMAGETD